LNDSTFEGENGRTSSVAPSADTCTSRIARRGISASTARKMNGAVSGVGRVSKHPPSWL
jgi:hypothetical protein